MCENVSIPLIPPGHCDDWVILHWSIGLVQYGLQYPSYEDSQGANYAPFPPTNINPTSSPIPLPPLFSVDDTPLALPQCVLEYKKLSFNVSLQQQTFDTNKPGTAVSREKGN